MALLEVLPTRNLLTDLHKIWHGFLRLGHHLNTPDGMSNGSGGDPHKGVKC